MRVGMLYPEVLEWLRCDVAFRFGSSENTIEEEFARGTTPHANVSDGRKMLVQVLLAMCVVEVRMVSVCLRAFPATEL